MSEELKPCPFCGGEPTPDFSAIEGEEAYHFHCQHSECPAWPNVQGETEAEAVSAWNRRAPDLAVALRNAREWIASLTVCDMNEIVADNGITAGMVVGQEAGEQVRRIDRVLAAPGGAA